MQTVKLGNILTVFNGYAFKKGDYKESGVLLFRQSNIGEGIVRTKKSKYLDSKFLETNPEFILKEGDVLVGMSGSIGEYCIYDLKTPALQNQRTGKLIFYKPEMSRYVLHYLPLLVKQLKDKAKGVAVQNISGKDLEAMDIPLYSLSQQQTIVNEIEKQFSRLDNGLQSLENIQTDLKNYKASVLKSAVEGKLTAQRRKENKNIEPASKLLEKILAERKKQREQEHPGKKYKKPQKIDTAGVSDLPEGWCRVNMDQITYFIGSGITPKGGREVYKKDGVIFIRSQNVYFNELFLDDVAHITEEQDTIMRRSKVQDLDILLNITGASIGRCCVVPKGFPKANVNQHVCIIRQFKVLPKYLCFYLGSPVGQKKIDEYQSGVTRQGLNYDQLKSIILPLPPLKEQQQIVQEVEEKLSVVDVILNVIEINIKRAKQLKQSILHQAFTGQLVPMKDDDKGIDELLTEIEKTKAMLIGQKKNKKVKQK